MGNKFGALFGGVLAIALLLLYAFSAWAMILTMISACPGDSCNSELADKYGAGFRYVLTTVGGLVSALVIARLSISQPGQVPTFQALQNVGKGLRAASDIAAALYLLVWAATGLAALVVGVMLYPDVIQTVSDLGTVWLGLAVAAGYAYFGLTPPETAGGTRRTASAAVAAAKDSTVSALEKHIQDGKIKFDKAALEDELLGKNSGTKVTSTLQNLVLHLADTVGSHIRISSLVRESGHHALGRAVDIGNEDIADEILPEIVPLVGALSVDELIFDAAVAGKSDRNEWNHDNGKKHNYDAATLDDHKTHIHFSVLT